MVGLVIVSHSAGLAEGVVELAAQMAGPDVRIGAAGGLDEPGGALGTDAAKVLRTIDDVWSEDGVLVLMDLGSAVLSAELALDLLEDERRERVRLTAAPLVEGAVAAAVAAGLGESLDAVAAAARSGLEAKKSQLSGGEPEAFSSGETAESEGGGPREQTVMITVKDPLGLHARPAALLVRTAAGFDARVRVTNVTNGRGPVSARSLNGVGTLGARRGDVLVVGASGPDAAAALAAVSRLADDGFGELEESGGTGAEAETSVAAAEARHAQPATPAELPAPAAGTVLAGLPAAPGTAVGPARTLRRTEMAPAAPAADPAAEWSALQRALAATATDLRASRASVKSRAGEHEAAIFDAHVLFLEDEALLEPTRAGVFSRGLTAAQAWAGAVGAAAACWDALEDPYQRARAADLRAVGDQVLGRLAQPLRADTAVPAAAAATACPAPFGASGAAAPPAGSGLTPGIVVTSDLSPAAVVGLDPALVAGIACAYSGPTSHAVILARALGLPAVVGAGAALLAVPEGTILAVDGDAGTVTVAPSPDAVTAVQRRRAALAHDAAAALSAAAHPAVTRDGVRIQVEANISGPRDAPAAVAAGADGVGLLRTEFLFLGAAALPGEDEQAVCYEAVAAALDGRPLTVRTLDAGADKSLPYLPLTPEANPFLGVRGLRLSLQHPDQLLSQLRAVLRVAAARPLRVMVPMVSSVEELRRARELLAEARASLEARGVAVPARLDFGMMLEVPSAALVADHLAPLVDFFSVGTNDLTQYTMAAERGNAGVAALADPLHPAVLRLIERTVAAAGRTPVAVCGEVAGDPLAVPLLLGLGVRELSMSPALIPAAKQAVRTADAGAARRLAQEALAADSAAAVRRLLAAAAALSTRPSDAKGLRP